MAKLLPEPGSTVTAAANPPPRIWTQHVASSDIDYLAAEQGGWRLRYEQLSRGAFLGELRLVQLPGMRVLLERSNRALRQRGDIGAMSYGFALALDMPGELRFAGRKVNADTLMMGRGDDIDMCTPAGFAFIAITVERAILAPLWQELYGKPLPGWLDHPVAAVAAPAPAAALRQLHLATLACIDAHPDRLMDSAAVLRLRDALLLEWLEAIPARVDAGGLQTLNARRRLVDRACAQMHTCADEPMTMAELCKAVGASPRKLGYCFAEVLGTSPARYLRLSRLNAARSALRCAAAEGDSGAGVQDIAAGLGFWHFGQFAHDYRNLFAELPSQTLKGGKY